MADIDRKLSMEGVDIPSRSIHASREVSMRFDLNMPLGGDPARMPPDLRKNVELSEAIHRWYQDNYGDRLKEDPCPGHSVLLLDGDLYKLRVPRLFGSVEFIVTRDWLPEPGISRAPVIANIVQLVADMTPSRAERLSDDALRHLAEGFERALPVSYLLESTSHALMYSARGDVDVAVRCLMERGDRHGSSKWASLQVAEKVLKAAIVLEGASFAFTHDLSKLSVVLADAGIAIDADNQIAAIQCSAGIRYGEEACSREEALAAHHASLDLVNLLHAAGAKFEPGIGGFSA
ncbi:MAG: hypothetical protein AAGI28_02510 [Pseudomonadota bacterium]